MQKIIFQGHTLSHDTRHAIELLVASQITDIGPQCYRADAVSSVDINALRSLLSNLPVDANILPAARQWKDFGLLAMDMDSTLITIECIDEIADMYGLKDQVAEITEAAMQGKLDFTMSLQRRVALLAGLAEDALAEVFEHRLRLSEGALEMLEAARSHGLKTLLVSGGFTYFTERLKMDLGLDFARSNQLEIVDGKLTGRVLGDIVDARVKRETVEATCKTLGFTPERAIVMGDGANDLQMMSVAGLSVAFHAKPVVRDSATVSFNHVGLNGLIALLN